MSDEELECQNHANCGDYCETQREREMVLCEDCLASFDLRESEQAELKSLRVEVARLKALIDTPRTDEWFEAVRLEAAHQINRWGTDHDTGKQPADWFWLLGYLGQKAMTAQMAGDVEKAKHHTISSGAMLLNWFRAMVGDTNAMRPGTEGDA